MEMVRSKKMQAEHQQLLWSQPGPSIGSGPNMACEPTSPSIEILSVSPHPGKELCCRQGQRQEGMPPQNQEKREREDMVLGVSSAMGKIVQTALAVFHSYWTAIRHPCHHPSQYWSVELGRLQPKLGRKREQLGPDWACERGWRRLKAGVRWAGCSLADRGEGARLATILSHSSGKPTSPDRAKYHISNTSSAPDTGGLRLLQVLSTEAQICLGTEKWERRWKIRVTAGP